MAMEDAQEARGPIPPYVAYKTFRNFVDSLRQGVPSRIDRSLMATMSGGAQGALIATLRFLGFINEVGTPTETFREVVRAEGQERQRMLRAILETAYVPVFGENFDLAGATAQSFEERFRRLATGDTVRKCEGFFIAAAKDANLPLSPYVMKRGALTGSGRTPRQRVRRPIRPPAGNTNGTGQEKPPAGRNEHEPGPPPADQPWARLLLEKFPSFDPSWPDDVKAKWFDAFDRLMSTGGKPDQD